MEWFDYQLMYPKENGKEKSPLIEPGLYVLHESKITNSCLGEQLEAPPVNSTLSFAGQSFVKAST